MLRITANVENYLSIDREKLIDDFIKNLLGDEFWHVQFKKDKTFAVFSTAWDEEKYNVEAHVATLHLEVVMNFLRIELSLEEFCKTEQELFNKFYNAFKTAFNNQEIETEVSFFYKRVIEGTFIKETEMFEIEKYDLNRIQNALQVNCFFKG